MARAGYSLLLTLLQPLYWVRIWWRGRAEPLYRHAMAERFGFHGKASAPGPVWVHAVSLGETRAAAALVTALRAAMPGMRLLLTHGTATGREAGAALLQPGDRQAWLPYDSPAAVRRFFAHFRPVVGVVMETEVWPNLFLAARAHGVPLVLANARLSERSFHKGRRLDALLRPAVESLALVLAQTDADAERLRSAGAARVQVSGNLKFDMAPDESQLARGHAWRAQLNRPVVLAASTREGEEAMLLAAWQRLALGQAHEETPGRPKFSHPPRGAGWAQPGPGGTLRPLLLIVPRHPQRFDEVAAQVEAAGLALARRSSWTDTPPAAAHGADVWLGDSLGEMALYYAVADVALLGGSFAPLGGQNLIEAAACGCPVVMGPHTFNFAEAAELARAAGAALRVAGMDEGVTEALASLPADARATRCQRSRAFAAQHRGAAARMAEQIAALARRA
jgi:3-deoxy-D-manno-octulosonic-acid transferase